MSGKKTKVMTKFVGFNMPEVLYEALRVKAFSDKTTISKLIRDAIDRSLES
jgi:hypothetical protein